MKDLIEAAVAAAGRSGVRTAVIVVGGDEGAGHSVVEHEHYHHGGSPEEIAALQDQLAQLAQARDSLSRQNEQVVGQLNEALANLREAQAEVVRLSAQEPQTPAAPEPHQEIEVVDYDSMPVATLNLPEKALKALVKHEVETIGQLRENYKNLPTWKVTKNDCIAVAEALMDRIPSRGGHTATTEPAQNSVPVSSGGATDVPEGHTDRPWKERVRVLRLKEKKRGELEQQMADLLEDLQQAAPGVPAAGDKEFFSKTCAAIVSLENEEAQGEAAKLFVAYSDLGEKHIKNNVQALALLFALGFNPKVAKTLDAALEVAGLVHLMENVPVGAGA